MVTCLSDVFIVMDRCYEIVPISLSVNRSID